MKSCASKFAETRTHIKLYPVSPPSKIHPKQSQLTSPTFLLISSSIIVKTEKMSLLWVREEVTRWLSMFCFCVSVLAWERRKVAWCFWSGVEGRARPPPGDWGRGWWDKREGEGGKEGEEGRQGEEGRRRKGGGKTLGGEMPVQPSIMCRTWSFPVDFFKMKINLSQCESSGNTCTFFLYIFAMSALVWIAHWISLFFH